jgi:hypothetical protein
LQKRKTLTQKGHVKFDNELSREPVQNISVDYVIVIVVKEVLFAVACAFVSIFSPRQKQWRPVFPRVHPRSPDKWKLFLDAVKMQTSQHHIPTCEDICDCFLINDVHTDAKVFTNRPDNTLLRHCDFVQFISAPCFNYELGPPR